MNRWPNLIENTVFRYPTRTKAFYLSTRGKPVVKNEYQKTIEIVIKFDMNATPLADSLIAKLLRKMEKRANIYEISSTFPTRQADAFPEYSSWIQSTNF